MWKMYINLRLTPRGFVSRDNTSAHDITELDGPSWWFTLSVETPPTVPRKGEWLKLTSDAGFDEWEVWTVQYDFPRRRIDIIINTDNWICSEAELKDAGMSLVKEGWVFDTEAGSEEEAAMFRLPDRN